MRSNRLWIGVTCGVALALGGVAAVDAGTQTAGAKVVVEATTSWPSGWKDRHGHPFTVSIDQHVIDQRIAQAGLKKRLWARLDKMGNITAKSGPSFTSEEQGTGKAKGKYVVDFKTKVSACSWTASPVLVGNAAANPTLLAAVTAGVATQPTQVTVYVLNVSGTTDNNVDVQVLC